MDKEHKCGCQEGTGCDCTHEHDHNHEGCGCGEEHHEHFVIDLEDDNGNIVSCDIVDSFEFEENEYVLAQDPNEDSYYLFRVGEDEELTIPEEEEFDRVSKFYEQLASEE